MTRAATRNPSRGTVFEAGDKLIVLADERESATVRALLEAPAAPNDESRP